MPFLGFVVIVDACVCMSTSTEHFLFHDLDCFKQKGLKQI